MKRSITFIRRLKALWARPAVKTAVGVFVFLAALYFFSIFGDMLSSPGFTYADF